MVMTAFDADSICWRIIMEGNWRPRALRDLGYYFVKSLKFYGLKAEYLTPVIFTIMLFVGFASQNISSIYFDRLVPLLNTANTDMTAYLDNIKEITYNFMYINLTGILTYIVLGLISTVYLIANIRQLKGESYSFKSCIATAAKSMHKLIIASVLYILAISTGILLFILPGIIFYVMFIFNSCYILDKGNGVIGAFKASYKVTKGSKAQIFGIVVLFNLVILLVPSLFAGSISNSLINIFVASFLSAIFNLMFQRLVAHMYIDLEYGYVEK